MEDLSARYAIGDAMTFDQMQESKKGEVEFSVHNPFTESKEVNAYVFEDTPVGTRKYVLLNIVGEGFPQQHEKGGLMIKVKVATVTANQAKELSKSMAIKDPKYGLYVVEMFKFICLPSPSEDVTVVDSLMNTAIQLEYDAMEDQKGEFNRRKSEMMDEVERHNEITKKIAAGELDSSAAESNPKYPEEIVVKENEEDMVESMEADAPQCADRFVVLATLKISKCEKLKGSMILKICGSFETEAMASTHMKALKKSLKYKLFDVCVCDMYSWLQMPPPYELIENVIYDSNKLTEALGVRKQTIDVNSAALQEPQDM